MEHEEISLRNSLNELTGSEWLYFTKSILTISYPSEYGHRLRKAHGANKPPQLMSQLIEFFTKSNGHVLDPFAGVGGTLIGASICRKPRTALGIEINPRWVEIYQRIIAESNGKIQSQELIQGDCLQVLPTLSKELFDFIVTDPPYNIHLEKTMSIERYAENFANRRTDYDMHSEIQRISQTFLHTMPIWTLWSKSLRAALLCLNRRNIWLSLCVMPISTGNIYSRMWIWRAVPNYMALSPKAKSSGTRLEHVYVPMATLLLTYQTSPTNTSSSFKNLVSSPTRDFVRVELVSTLRQSLDPEAKFRP